MQIIRNVLTVLKKYFFPVACLLLIGTGIGFHFLMVAHPFEYDEIFTTISANPTLPLSFLIHKYLLPDVHPPLHNVFLWAYNHLTPYGQEFWLRLPSLVSSFAALICAWVFFPKRYGKMSRYIFTALCSTNFFVIFYAQQARPYAFLFLWGMLLLLLLMRMLPRLVHNRSISHRYWVAYTVLLMLLMWTHYLGAVVAVIVSAVWFTTSCYYKRYRGISIGLPIGVLALFMIWFIPNFLANRELSRFNGTWWGNFIPSDQALPTINNLLAHGPFVYYGFAALWMLGLAFAYYQYRRKHIFLYEREWLFCAGVISLVLSAAAVLFHCFHMNFFIARYFMGMLPFVYLFFTLCILSLLRKCWLAKIGFVVLVGWSLFPTFAIMHDCKFHYGFLAKLTSELIRKHPKAVHKKLYVITGIPFPVQAMEPMYGFYLNQRFGDNMSVFELGHRPENEREALLKNRQDAVIWVPDCSPNHLKNLALSWKRQIGVEQLIYRAGCLIQFADRGYSLNPPFLLLFPPPQSAPKK